MIRQGAELQNAATNGSKRSNAHNGDWYDDILNHDMELDDHQSQANNWDRMDTEESSEQQVEYQRLLDDTLMYGRDLQAEFKDDQRREVSKALEDAFALMAYSDPLNAKEVSHLLDPSGRLAVAEELNSAILRMFLHYPACLTLSKLTCCRILGQIFFSGSGTTLSANYHLTRRPPRRRRSRRICQY